MIRRTLAHAASLLLLVFCCSTPSAAAQRAGTTAPVPVVQSNRIAASPDLSVRTKLTGHVPAWVRTSADLGPAAAGDALKLDLVLTRAPARQAAFEQLLADQQTPGSSRYHQWLTPTQIGDGYGPTPDDVAAIVAWLTASGLQVDEVTPSRMFIRISAPASLVASAFSTVIHRVRIAGDTTGTTRLAALEEPEVPAAFRTLIASIAGLSETPDTPQGHSEARFGPVLPGMTPALASRTGARSTVASDVAAPSYTSSSTGNHYITPGDFAVLYDLNSIYGSGIDGTGQRVAIIGRSRINSADILNFEIATGSTSRLQPSVIVPPAGIDPGIVSGDEGEATLDVQRVIGTAPGASIDLIISSSAGGGLRTAVQYNVQTLADPIMNISFGACEAVAGPANIILYTNLFAQGAAEGISTFVSSGDAGAAGCDGNFQVPPATQVASINYICSSHYATCVGGTEFADGGGSYWNTTNTSSRVSALSYIPEGAWNDSLNFTSGGVPIFIAAASGGGASTYTAKPSFQTGLGVPPDGFRDVPDVSFSAAAHDAYFSCFANGLTGSCTVDPTTNLFYYTSFYGTSAAAPSMAGVTALLNQKLTSRQGNLNPLIYRLASTNAGVFKDTTVASSGVAGCSAAMPSMCNNSIPSATAATGGLAGYVVTPGFDLATGWGSLDVSAFIAAAASIGTPTGITLTSLNGVTGVPTDVTLNFSVQVTPAGSTPQVLSGGSVQLYANGTAFGPAYPIGTASNGSNAVNILLANPLSVGTYLITAQYSGNGSFDPSISGPATLVLITPGSRASTTQLVATASGLSLTLTTTVAGPSGNATPTPTGAVTYSIVTNGVATPLSVGYLVNQGSSSLSMKYAVLPVGSYAIQAVYTGDAVYAPSTSNTVSVTTTPNSTSTLLSASSYTATTAQTVTLQATVSASLVTYPIVSFMDGGTLLGTAPLTSTVTGYTASFTAGPFSMGTHTLTAVFAGDTNNQRSASPPAIVVVTLAPAITLAAGSTSLTFAAGSASGNTDALTFTSVGGFAGPVTLSCSVAFSGGIAAVSPTCSVSPNPVAVAAGGTGSASLSLTTTKASSSRIAAADRTTSVVYGVLLVGIPFAWCRRKYRKAALLAALIVFACFTGLTGCGGSSQGSGSTPTPGTTAGNYVITVTASSPGISNTSLTIPLMIQ